MTAAELFIERESFLQKYQAGFGVHALGKTGRIAARTSKANVIAGEINKGAMSVACIVSTQDEDNSLDIIVTDGIDLTDHERNPVVNYNHGHGLAFPIGKAQTTDGKYTVTREPGILKAVTYFSQNLLEAEQIFALIEEGILNGVSIGAIPLDGGIEKRGVTNWKGMPGLLVRACKMHEYSHTPQPDNPQALTDRVRGGKPIAGKSLSGSLYKSLEPYLVSTPTQISVPELATAIGSELEKALKKAGIIKADDPPPDKKDPPADPPPEKKDPPPDTEKTDPPADDDPTKDYPPGAKAAAGIYDRMSEMGDFIGESMKGQENPAVKELLDEMAGEITERCDSLKSFFKENYGELPELGGKSDADADDPPPDEPPSKSLKRRHILPYRESILKGIKAGTDTAKLAEATKQNETLTADKTALEKALRDSLDRESKLRRRVNQLRNGATK